MGIVHHIVEMITLGLELIAIALIVIGAAGAVIRIVHMLATGLFSEGARDVFLHMARWTVLALEFTLAADVVHTAIAPDWDAIGRLAAIAVIRTLLSVFLMRDLQRMVLQGAIAKNAERAG